VLRLSKLGEGVAELDGRTVFIEDALPGERVRVRVELGGKVLRGQLLEVVQPSPDRRAPACPRANTCGGCDWLHLDEAAQRRAKEEIVQSALEHLGQVSRAEYTLLPTVASPRALGYRRRAVLHFAGEALGLFARKSHHCLPVDACPALEGPLAELPGALSPHLAPLKGDATSVHLVSAEGKVAFAVFLEGPVKPRHEAAAEAAIRALGLRGAVLVPKEGSPTLLGKPTLQTSAPLRPEIPLFLRPDAFAQANAEANQALVAATVEASSVRAGDRVLEMYAGNGNFTFAVAGLARSVVAVESGQVSVEMGRRSAQQGRVQNVRFVQGDARKVAEGLAKEGEKFDVLLMDPPRTGAPNLAPLARSLGARRVVYVACDPAALARDAAELRRAGFSPVSVQLVDMFPQTRHVEAVMAFAAGASEQDRY
jgi:23S rRNA (uracil1939-C5)-methyltransferase